MTKGERVKSSSIFLKDSKLVKWNKAPSPLLGISSWPNKYIGIEVKSIFQSLYFSYRRTVIVNTLTQDGTVQ